MMHAITMTLYFSLLASFFTFVVLYAYYEREALKTVLGRSILMFFGAITTAMIFFAAAHFNDLPGESLMKLLIYLALNAVGWGAPMTLLRERRRAMSLERSREDG